MLNQKTPVRKNVNRDLDTVFLSGSAARRLSLVRIHSPRIYPPHSIIQPVLPNKNPTSSSISKRCIVTAFRMAPLRKLRTVSMPRLPLFRTAPDQLRRSKYSPDTTCANVLFWDCNTIIVSIHATANSASHPIKISKINKLPYRHPDFGTHMKDDIATQHIDKPQSMRNKS
ncbi:hypothetical protein [Rhizobium cremeum]|uniref:hypothetical protein n=1 Tax=Rhizobium cremeum TaxID=2813827 RepID=UPI0013AF0696